VPSIVFAVNKVDALDDPGPAFAALREALGAFAAQAGFTPAGIVPVSALRGDNVTAPLDAPWYRGPSLLKLLEQLPAAAEPAGGPFRLPVQYIARDGEGIGEQPRVFWGRVAEGRVSVGDAVQVFPSGERARVVELRRAGSVVDEVPAGRSAGLVLERQLDISRGDWITAVGHGEATRRFEATLAWLDTEPAIPGRKYWVRHAHRWVQARIVRIDYRLDIHTLEPTDAHELGVNEIGAVEVELQQPLPLEPYATSRIGGALIVVDPASHRTSGALLVSELAPGRSCRAEAKGEAR
jgi:sulfate adenylyltransferase subunit 1